MTPQQKQQQCYFSYLNELGNRLFPQLLSKHLRHDSLSPLRLKPFHIFSITCHHVLIYISIYTGELYTLTLKDSCPIKLSVVTDRPAELKLCLLYV